MTALLHRITLRKSTISNAAFIVSRNTFIWMNVEMTFILRVSVCVLLFLGVFGIQRINRFTQRTASEGQPLCFADPPSQVIRGVRSGLSCVMEYCASTQNCLSANYRKDTGICELYDFCPGQEIEVQGCRNVMVIPIILFLHNF